MRYFALVDPPEFTPQRPLSLLRSPGEGLIEAFSTDGRWHPDGRYSLLSGDSEHDLVELTAEQAAAVMPLWRDARVIERL
jgi:hypothetical protein